MEEPYDPKARAAEAALARRRRPSSASGEETIEQAERESGPFVFPPVRISFRDSKPRE